MTCSVRFSAANIDGLPLPPAGSALVPPNLPEGTPSWGACPGNVLGRFLLPAKPGGQAPIQRRTRRPTGCLRCPKFRQHKAGGRRWNLRTVGVRTPKICAGTSTEWGVHRGFLPLCALFGDFEQKRCAVVSSPDGPERGRAQGRKAARRPVRVVGKPGVANRQSVTTCEERKSPPGGRPRRKKNRPPVRAPAPLAPGRGRSSQSCAHPGAPMGC